MPCNVASFLIGCFKHFAFRIIGVVQMVNKKIGQFTKGDEQAFETFAVYCGLALHHAKVRRNISRHDL